LCERGRGGKEKPLDKPVKKENIKSKVAKGEKERIGTKKAHALERMPEKQQEKSE